MNENDDLRQLFADATSDIRPQGSLDDILDRSKKVDPMTRRWFLPVVAAAAVIGLAIGGAAWLANDSNSPNDDHGPAGTATADPTNGSSELPTKMIDVFYIGHTAAGPRLFSEKTPVQAARGDGDPSYVLGAAQKALADNPVDPDYRSAWPASVKIEGSAENLTDPSGTITLDFNDASVTKRPAGMSAEIARLSVEALVRTVQAAAGNDAPVEFSLTVDYTNGTPDPKGLAAGTLTAVLGVPIDGAYTPGPDDQVMAPVQITSLTDGQKVKAGDVTVSGVAATFEGNVVWELMVGGDTLVDNGHTTATECCTLAPYSFTITDLQPGTYTLVVHDEDMSGEGRPVSRDTKEIVVE